MGRRARGDGSVYFDADRGCWVGSVDVGRDPETGRRRRRKVSAPTKTEARAKLNELLGERRRTGTVAPRDTTVETMIRAFLASPPADWRSPVTVQVNGNHAKRVVAALGRRKLAQLTVSDVERLLNEMAAASYARATIAGTRTLLRRALRRAERDGQVGRNVADLAELPAAARRKSQSMTVSQIQALFASDLTPWWRAYLMTGILCGLRPGELLGLTWDDIGFADSEIRVRHCLKAVPGPDGHAVLQLEDLKTERSKRTLALPGKAAEALRALRAAQAAGKLRLGRSYTDQGLVFCGSAGQPLWGAGVRVGFKRVCRRAGIGPDWHPHEQRHTFVSVLSDAGLDIEQIADAAGHVNSSVTRTVYRHQIADKVTRVSEAMDRIFGSGSAS
jgi:integrase